MTAEEQIVRLEAEVLSLRLIAEGQAVALRAATLRLQQEGDAIQALMDRREAARLKKQRQRALRSMGVGDGIATDVSRDSGAAMSPGHCRDIAGTTPPPPSSSSLPSSFPPSSKPPSSYPLSFPPSSPAPTPDLFGAASAPPPLAVPVTAKRKPLADKPPGDVRHQPLVDALFASGWSLGGGRGAKAVKDLLALADERETTRGDAAPGEVSRRAALARAHTGFPSVRSLWELVTHWAHFETAGPAPNVSRGGVRAETQDHTLPQEPF